MLDSPHTCRALFHCNYCARDISATVRIKCAECPDFDLCLDCFAVGVEITPHKSGHAYRVVDNLSFPLYHPDWGVSTCFCMTDIALLQSRHICRVVDDLSAGGCGWVS